MIGEFIHAVILIGAGALAACEIIWPESQGPWAGYVGWLKTVAIALLALPLAILVWKIVLGVMVFTTIVVLGLWAPLRLMKGRTTHA